MPCGDPESDLGWTTPAFDHSRHEIVIFFVIAQRCRIKPVPNLYCLRSAGFTNVATAALGRIRTDDGSGSQLIVFEDERSLGCGLRAVHPWNLKLELDEPFSNLTAKSAPHRDDWRPVGSRARLERRLFPGLLRKLLRQAPHCTELCIGCLVGPEREPRIEL